MGKFIELFSSRFSGMTLWDVIDILFLSVIFFSAYAFVRRRRAFPALVGLAVFIGLRFAVKALGFSATFKFFDFFYGVGAIFIIVIFQSDIRSVLEKTGTFFIGLRRVLKRVFKPKSESKEVEAIMKAVARLSSSKTGALIVMEDNMGVDEIVERGVKLDAVISSELICNIFYAPAPLHDGAIIIKGDRIRSAACMLPSYTDPISADFGARHRAAIGMSRASDVFVIVISEETGVTSCAINGDLKTGFDYAALRELLNAYYGVKVKKTKDEKKAERQARLKAKCASGGKKGGRK